MAGRKLQQAQNLGGQRILYHTRKIYEASKNHRINCLCACHSQYSGSAPMAEPIKNSSQDNQQKPSLPISSLIEIQIKYFTFQILSNKNRIRSRRFNIDSPKTKITDIIDDSLKYLYFCFTGAYKLIVFNLKQKKWQKQIQIKDDYYFWKIFMCFSLKRKESRNLKNEYKALLETRRSYTSRKELASFLLWMIRFMEATIGKGQTSSAQGFCSDKKELNVRPEFVAAFQHCSIKEQMKYYSETVKYLTSDFSKGRQDQVITFCIQTQGFLKWSGKMIMKLFPNDYRLQIHCPENQKKECFINLRNYLFRKSRQTREHTYVLAAINSTEPKKITFAILKGDREQGQVSKTLREVSLNAYIQNVVKWKEQVVHINLEKPEKDPFYIPSQSSISSKSQKKQGAHDDLWKEIDQKIINRNDNGEESDEDQNGEAQKSNRKKNLPYEPIISSILDKVKIKEQEKIKQRKIKEGQMDQFDEQNQENINNREEVNKDQAQKNKLWENLFRINNNQKSKQEDSKQNENNNDQATKKYRAMKKQTKEDENQLGQSSFHTIQGDFEADNIDFNKFKQ